MARKKSIQDLREQLGRIKAMADAVRRNTPNPYGSDSQRAIRRTNSNREARAINAYYRYRDNIETSKAFDNSARKIAAKDPWALMAGANEKVKFSQRTYMGLANG